MPKDYLRLVFFLAIVGGTIALVVWLANSLLTLYTALESQPLLANGLIALLMVLLAVFVGASVYYLYVFRRPAAPGIPLPPPPPPKSLEEKRQVTQQNLGQLHQELAKIQDQVAREALAARSATVARALDHPRFKVVVFGTGSAGKTSLVNALLEKTVGDVGATIGTTLQTALYRWDVLGIPQPVDLVDSPGILEMGSGGQHREQEARNQAQAADLLLFVVDNDLRQSEYEPLVSLAQLGKRSLLILNKADRYTPTEQEILVAQLRERVAGSIAYEDVLLAAAYPAAIPTAKGSLQPRPDVAAVRDRIQAILLAEGEILLADNSLLQSQQLGEEARRIIAQQLQQQAEKVVERFQWIVTGVVFANPIPVIDLLAIAAINAQMVVEIGQVYGCKLNLDQGKELALSLGKTLASLGLVEGAIQLTTGLITMLAEVTVVGFLITAPIQAASAGYLTRIAGRSFIAYFQKQQQWGEGGMQSVILAQVQEAKTNNWFQVFIREATTKVFKLPLPKP